MNEKITYEVWEDEEDNSISLIEPSNLSMKKLLSPKAKLLRTIVAASWEEAMQNHYDYMGWVTYTL